MKALRLILPPRSAQAALLGLLGASGCSPSQPATIVGETPAKAAHLHTASDRVALWRVQGSYSSRNLLYISSPADGRVYVYTYPGGKRVGAISGLDSPFGECSDAAGNVFVVAYASASEKSSLIYEYAHGGSQPVETLIDPGRGAACAVEPTTGNLAVSNSSDESNPYSGYGSVAVYDHAQGDPAMYYSSEQHPFRFCGYDNLGNLYLVAPSEKYSNRFDFIELPQDSGSFQPIALKVELYDGYGGFTPSVQWDGKYITVSSAANARTGPVTVYRLDVSGTTAQVVGATELSSAKDHPPEGQTWIYPRTLIGVDLYRHNMSQISLWHYPKGGEPRRSTGLGFLEEPYGLTLSPASP
jgi:hypothetical protein